MKLPLNIEGIPQELKDLNQWVMWKLEDKRDQDKPAKVPYTTKNMRAKPTDPITWTSFENCVHALETGLYQGIGFVFCDNDEYVGIDWDNVRDPESGIFTEGIYQEVTNLGSYAEISLSGKGAHVICKGKKPGKRCRSGQREMYDTNRFFVMTGNHLNGTPLTINQPPPEAIRVIYDNIESPKKTTETPQNGSIEVCPQNDTKILSLLMSSKIASEFESLWNGSTVGYPSNSEADMALANYIAFYTQDEAQIERLMRRSSLVREKWDKHPTYLKETIKKAIKGLLDRHNSSKKETIESNEETDEVNPEMRVLTERISKQGDPVQFIIDTHQALHVGDLELAKTLLVSVGIQSVLNSDGIQPKVSGDSGKGKTHCCKAMAHLIPPKWIHVTTMSNKALQYMNVEEGSIIFCDDIDLSDSLEGTIKRSTSSFQVGDTYTTLDTNRKLINLHIPPRIVWWLTSVDDNQSLQLLNRQFGGGVDESEDQDLRVMEFQLQQAACGEVGLPLNDDVLICREIIRDIKTSKYIVKIPFAKDIIWRDLRNRRNLPIFLDIIKSYAVLRHKQRRIDQEGALIADIQDYNDAKALYTGRAENQGLKLNDAEMRLCIALANRGEATKEEVAKAMGVTEGRVRHLIFGKDKNKDAGLLHKVKGLTCEKRTVENNAGHKTQKMYLKLDGFDTLGMFDSVVSLRDDSTSMYPTSTPTSTIQNNMSRESSTNSTPIEKTCKGENGEYLTPSCVQNSKQGTNGTNGIPDDDKQGTDRINNPCTSRINYSDALGNEGITAIQRHVFDWAFMWERLYNTPLNSSNITDAAKEYCDKHKNLSAQFNDVVLIFKKYAKIPSNQPSLHEFVEVPYENLSGIN